jgi:starch phosphorylase
MSDIALRALRTRAGRSVDALHRSFVDNLFYIVGHSIQTASPNDLYTALAYTVRDRMLERFIATGENYKRNNARTVCYFSAEFLDSLATLEIPAIGYGIRYEFGLFDQTIKDGWQVEVTDAWLRDGNPWELPNRQRRFPVKLGGHTEQTRDEQGRLRVRWVSGCTVYGVAYDTPILGYGVINANLLRLWKAEARDSFDFQAFNTGDYYGAVEEMVVAENLTKVLYPNDEPEVGKELRLKQQYFFVSCSLQDMIRMALRDLGDLS